MLISRLSCNGRRRSGLRTIRTIFIVEDVLTLDQVESRCRGRVTVLVQMQRCLGSPHPANIGTVVLRLVLLLCWRIPGDIVLHG